MANRTCRTLAIEYTCREDMLRIVTYDICEKGVGMVDSFSARRHECPFDTCNLNRGENVTHTSMVQVHKEAVSSRYIGDMLQAGCWEIADMDICTG